jgi:hypothetical protein
MTKGGTPTSGSNERAEQMGRVGFVFGQRGRKLARARARVRTCCWARGRMLGLRSKNQHRDNEGVGGPWASGSLGTCVDEQIYRLCVGFRAGMHADRQAVGGWGALYPSPPTSHIDPAAVKSKSINHTQTKPSRFLRQRNATHLSRLCAATAGPPAYILNTDARIE